jgi:F-type H+-transporting ATPase subunit delta
MPKTVSQIKRTAKLLFRWCVVNERLDESRTRAVFRQVLQSKRRGYLALLSEFKRLVKLEHARRTAKVDSAIPLPVELQTVVRNTLEGVYGEAILTEFADRPDLIGGIRIQVSNDVYDGSVKSRLAALATCFGIPSA